MCVENNKSDDKTARTCNCVFPRKLNGETRSISPLGSLYKLDDVLAIGYAQKKPENTANGKHYGAPRIRACLVTGRYRVYNQRTIDRHYFLSLSTSTSGKE